jgi:O-antigen ligase
MRILKQSMRPAIQSKSEPGVQPGLLLRRRLPSLPKQVQRPVWSARRFLAGRPGAHWLAYAGIYLFTLLLYSRAQELIPSLFGGLPIIKIIAIATCLSYIATKLNRGESLTVWTIEVKMVLVLVVLSVLLIPVAAAPRDSIEMLTREYLKVVVIFIMMVNLLDTRERLLSFLKLLTIGGAWVALGALRSYNAGEFGKTVGGFARITSVGGGMFGNPNDIATALDLLLPLAVVLGLKQRGRARYAYFGCAAMLGVGVLITLSRGGFLGLLAVGIFLWWKLGHGWRVRSACAAFLIMAAFISVAPGNFGKRIATILNADADTTGSAQVRRELMKRATIVALAHPVGIGLDNFHLYSISEAKAHNSYLEISAELGLLGLFAYLTLIFAPFGGLRRVERETFGATDEQARDSYYLSVGLQASLVAYIVCSFFLSIQYDWYLYYPVAFAAALRSIHERESISRASEGAQDPIFASKPTPGLVWKSRQWPQPRAGSAILWAAPKPPLDQLRGGE